MTTDEWLEAATRDPFLRVRELAVEVLGSEEAAEAWLHRPAIGLNRARPIDMSPLPVLELLHRMHYGVYC